jgi:3-oxoacyl-[acyl-carrier protein] reductase
VIPLNTTGHNAVLVRWPASSYNEDAIRFEARDVSVRKYGSSTHKGMKKGDRRVALVTGATKGIGRAIARALGESGYTVLINFRRNRKGAEAEARHIRDAGGQADIAQADVTNAEEVERMFTGIKRDFGRLDVLINNVGDWLRVDMAKLTPADTRRMTESNYFSVVNCSLSAAKIMRKQKSGRIVNLGYVYAERLQAYPSVAAYYSAKHAMFAFSVSLAKDLARHKVTVNIVSPGINVNSVEKPDDPKTLVPFGRLGKYTDLINAIMFLLKPESEYITGTHIKVSGGHAL